MAPSNVRGGYYVFPTATAITRAWKLCGGRMRDYQLLRRCALKLAYWPDGGDDEESATDIDWDWIKALEKKRIGELRVDEVVNGFNNVRVIFFKANKALAGDPPNPAGDPLKRIWLLTAFHKNRQEFTNTELRSFTAMRDLIVQRYYDGSSQA